MQEVKVRRHALASATRLVSHCWMRFGSDILDGDFAHRKKSIYCEEFVVVWMVVLACGRLRLGLGNCNVE